MIPVMDASLVRGSKFMSLVLRHDPQKFGLALDAHGWAQLDDLMAAANRAGVPLTHAVVEQIVAENDKQRFALSDDGRAIRARQGHSITVELGLTSRIPPSHLYHGTASRFLTSIREQGLRRGTRHHVHLSADVATAQKVGQRHGKAIVLTVQSGAMCDDGYHFYQAENGVWLIDAVPVNYLLFP